VVTIFHSVTKELSLPLPWPRPSTSPAHANSPILIWGGASSCGQYALQILTHWGYTNLLATASPVHHAYLRSLGASHVFDYRDVDVASDILEAAAAKSPANDGPVIPFLFDCIGSRVGSLAQLAKMAQRGSRVAVLLPVIVTHATDAEAPEYTGDVQASAEWAEGVEVRGVRTHFYAEVTYCRPSHPSRFFFLFLFRLDFQCVLTDTGVFYRTRFLRNFFNLLSSRHCWLRGWSGRISRRLCKATRCWRGRRMHWICSGEERLAGRDWCGGFRNLW
jgi:hypothetical protein